MKRRARKMVGLGEFIPMVSRSWVNPLHLAPYVAQLERAIVEPVRLCFAKAPRFGGTETWQHAIPWWLLQRPDLRIVIAGYSQRFAERRGRRVRALAQLAGVPMDPTSSSRSDWRTGHGDGGVYCTSTDGSITGEGADIIILTDPHKDRAAAESAADRNRIDEWTRDTLFTRLEPDGSMFVEHARWNLDDQIGRLQEDGWPTISIPALNERGESIWPARWPVARLREIEETLGSYGFESLYMQRPMSRGGRPFEGVEFFDALPETVLATATGLDFGYTAKTSSDPSVAVTVVSDGELIYVVDVRCQRVTAPAFKATLKSVLQDHPGTALHAYIGGTERALVDFLAGDGVRIDAKPAITDKFVRATSCAARWSARKILVPRSLAALRRPGEPEGKPEDGERRPAWLDAFVSEVVGFTGTTRDKHDDHVDALVAAYDAVKDCVARRAPRVRRYLAPDEGDFTDFSSYGGSGFGGGRGTY